MADDLSAEAAAERLGRALSRLEAATRRLLVDRGDDRSLRERHRTLCREVETTLSGLDRLISSAEAR